MNHWARMLANLPAALQQAIARRNRISLPRSCTPDERQVRLRRALCRQAAVRATYHLLTPAEQAALQELRHTPRGLRPADLVARFGPIRASAHLRADPTPQSLSERLLLLGWLLPRPAAPRNPPRYLLPPELRRWLPQPPRFAPHGEPPAATPPPAIAVATALLLACATAPLPLRADGQLGRPARRRLAPLLAAAAPAPLDPACALIWPLLQRLGLVAVAHRQATLSPAAARFLARPAAERLAVLRAAWMAMPDGDAWLRPLLLDQRGIDWPGLRRRLCDWAATLPADQAVDPVASYAMLAAAHGPLADAHTHGFRRVDRAPWQPRRATVIWHAALAGPLTTLGYVAWNTSGGCARLDVDAALVAPALPWQADTQTIRVPASAVDGDILKLARFASGYAGDRAGFCLTLDRRSLAAAARAGYHPHMLRSLLQHRLAHVPPELATMLDTATPAPRIAQVLLFSSDSAQLLDRLAQQRSVRRTLAGRLAPGLALVQPEYLSALERALLRQGLAPLCDLPAAPPLACDVLPGDRAALLLACAFYRRYAPPDAPLLPPAILEDRLRSSLPPALRDAVGQALADITPHSGAAVPPPSSPAEAPLAAPAEPTPDLEMQLRRGIARRSIMRLRYHDANGTCSERSVRPLQVYRNGPDRYLQAYCLLRRAERSFRLDRIQAVGDTTTALPPGDDSFAPDMVIERVGGDPPDAKNLNAALGDGIEPVDPHTIGVAVDNTGQFDLESPKLPLVEIALKDTVLHADPIALEQLEHLRAAPVIHDIVTD